MSPIDVGTFGGKARLVVDDEYFDVARTVIREARHTCLASLFIVDLKSDPQHSGASPFELLKDLRDAHWRGANVKLLIGGSRSNLLIAETAEVARYVVLGLGISARWLTSQDVRGSHAKLLIADERVLAGSHNWSMPAFTSQIQDSVLVESAGLAAYMGGYFMKQWQRAE
jgi:hypothetical protein